MRNLIILYLLIPSLSWGESIIYQCKYLKSYTATFDYPQNIIAIVDFNEGKLDFPLSIMTKKIMIRATAITAPT